MSSKMNTELVLCDCSSMEHQMVIVSFSDEPEVLYLQIHLARKPLLARIKTAFWHILGRRSKTGDWDEIITTRENLKKALYGKEENNVC